MPGVFEIAPSGRAKCRGCAQSISKGDLRFGERLPNPFAEGDMTIWFHPLCAAYKRPEPLQQALSETAADVPGREGLNSAAEQSLAQRRLPRIDGAERSPTSQAKCRSCHEPIERGSWRIRLVFFEDGMFSAGGFIHFGCSLAYFETRDVTERVLRFSPALAESDREELKAVKL